MGEDLNKIGFWSTMTLIPVDLSAKMDRLAIGVLPVKMKAIYMFGAARWLHVMMGLMKPFLSKKMRERIIIVTEAMPPESTGGRQHFVEELVSRESIPIGFMGLEGGSTHNAMFDKLLKKKKKKDKKEKKKQTKGINKYVCVCVCVCVNIFVSNTP